MNIRIVSLLHAALFLALANCGEALQYCIDQNTQVDCEDAVKDAVLGGARATVSAGPLPTAGDQEKARRDAARRLLAGVSPEIASLPGASAAFETFLNRLKIQVSTDNSSDKEALAIDFTGLLSRNPDNRYKDGYKAQLVAREPELFKPLADKLAEEARKAQQDRLGSFDDMLLTLAYSPSTERFGVSLSGSQEFVDRLFHEMTTDHDRLREATLRAEAALDDLISESKSDFPSAFSNDKVENFGKIENLSRRISLREAVEAAALADATSLAADLAVLKDGNFFDLADLAANQPQWVLKATRTFRSELTGQDETTLHVAFEKGFVNLNALRKALRDCAGPMAICYRTYLTDNRRGIAKNQNRITFSLDWASVQAYHNDSDGTTLDLPSRERWTAAFAYGKNVAFDAAGVPMSRFDLTGSWEDWSDDPMRQDRGVAMLSFTQKVTDDTSMVLGAVWATKPEFLGEVDRGVSARFGFTYRVVSKEDKKATGQE